MEHVFKNIGIIYNPEIEKAKETAEIFSKKFNDCKVFTIDKLENNIDLAIAIGGDGSFLKVARYYSEYSIPILGVNMGRLGYLAQVKPVEIDEAINKINLNQFEIENRLMLKAINKTALNDIVVKGEHCARTATLDLYINDKLLCSYVSDGLIIATPTGSTAYSLSAGGPIVSPELECFLIIPICPHTLNTRPVIVLSSEKISIKNHENSKLNVSFDGQVDVVVENEIKIEKNEKNAPILILNQQKDKFYDILKEKLHWSISPEK
ncbi:MAG: NAD(+)/NADH kinase [Candidatus Gastranaerophilales bacterium]|nr:NAD(+)/NADH kinase [Candidatus Gastranaerophilales bacterium]